MKSAHDSAAVEFVEALICQAIGMRASDIHLEPIEDGLRVRVRVDGILCDTEHLAKSLMAQVTSRLKVLAGVDLAQKRIPQDGKFVFNHDNRPIDLRVSTFPSLFGEKVVIRILDKDTHAMSLDTLGLCPRMLSSFRHLLRRSSGFFLVTGPTGSGKTTTLYAALSELHSPEKNIVTLEDPVEYCVPGVTQGQIHPAAGFTFERGIRSLLRQDPDVLMVGEIRDKQTARIAIEAALTGHVVLSTLHTNDAPSAIMRLMDMGIEPYLINAALTGVLAQRLVRKICSDCKKNRLAAQEELDFCKKLGISDTTLLEGVGCATCNNLGYKGRTGLFELLVLTPGLSQHIRQAPIPENIYQQALKDGMLTLVQDGVEKVRSGITTLTELIRTTC